MSVRRITKQGTEILHEVIGYARPLSRISYPAARILTQRHNM
jgi:hypothetical protein